MTALDVVRKTVAEKVDSGVRVFTVDSVHGAIGGSLVRTRSALDRMVRDGLLEKAWTIYDADGSNVWGGTEAPHLPSVVREHAASTGCSAEPDDYHVVVFYESTAPRVSDYDRGVAQGRAAAVAWLRAEANRFDALGTVEGAAKDKKGQGDSWQRANALHNAAEAIAAGAETALPRETLARIASLVGA